MRKCFWVIRSSLRWYRVIRLSLRWAAALPMWGVPAREQATWDQRRRRILRLRSVSKNWDDWWSKCIARSDRTGKGQDSFFMCPRCCRVYSYVSCYRCRLDEERGVV